MTFDENIQAIANDTLLPKVVDGIYNSNFLTARMLSNMKTFMGPNMEKPIRTSSAGNGGSFSGLDKFATNTVDTKQKLSFDPRGYEQPVIISQLEADAVASSQQKSVELVATAIEESKDELLDGVGSLLYADGTGNSNKDFLGLAAIVDDGGEVATYGGLSRSTVGAPIQASEQDLGGALTLAAMATSYTAAQRGSQRPTIIITTEAIWDDYEALNAAFIQNTQVGTTQLGGETIMGQNVGSSRGLAGDAGFETLRYRGRPIVADEKATSGTMWFLNENWLAFYRLQSTSPMYKNITAGGDKNIEGIYSDTLRGAGLDWSGLMSPTDQYAQIGHILLLGNLISFNPRMHAVINTIS
jgi:hypothetical protein